MFSIEYKRAVAAGVAVSRARATGKKAAILAAHLRYFREVYIWGVGFTPRQMEAIRNSKRLLL